MTSRNVVLLGKVGHGKTRVLNHLCGTDFASSMSATSCTREIQIGASLYHRLCVVDTPGFYSSDDVDLHSQAQRKALENDLISGVYAVIKYSSSSEIAEVANRLMDFVGEDDIRIIITHADTVEELEISDLKTDLYSLLDIPCCNITVIGKQTSREEIESFVFSTLHSPRHLEVSKDQMAAVASLSVGARQFNKEIDALPNILLESEKALEMLYSIPNCEEKRVFCKVLFQETNCQVIKSKCAIEENAKGLLPKEQKMVLQRIKKVLDPAVASFRSKHDPNNRKRRQSYRFKASSTEDRRNADKLNELKQAHYAFLLSYLTSTAELYENESSDACSFGTHVVENRFTIEPSAKFRSSGNDFESSDLHSSIEKDIVKSDGMMTEYEPGCLIDKHYASIGRGRKPWDFAQRFAQNDVSWAPGGFMSSNTQSYYNMYGVNGKSSVLKGTFGSDGGTSPHRDQRFSHQYNYTKNARQSKYGEMPAEAAWAGIDPMEGKQSFKTCNMQPINGFACSLSQNHLSKRDNMGFPRSNTSINSNKQNPDYLSSEHGAHAYANEHHDSTKNNENKPFSSYSAAVRSNKYSHPEARGWEGWSSG